MNITLTMYNFEKLIEFSLRTKWKNLFIANKSINNSSNLA